MLVFGGSLGARSINRGRGRGVRAARRFRVLHICGRRDYAELLARGAAGRGYDLREYLDSRTSPTRWRRPTWRWRARAARCSRSPRTALPAMLVPYPHAAGDHQSANARWMADAGAAVVIADAELTAARLAREVAALLADRARGWRRWPRRRAALARPDAAREVAARAAARRPRG